MVGNFYHKRLQMSQSDLLCLAIHGFKSSVSSHKYLISNNFNLTEPIIFFKTVIRLLEHECCHKKPAKPSLASILGEFCCFMGLRSLQC